jgi:hypothetical protein
LLASVTIISLALGALLGPLDGRWSVLWLVAFAVFGVVSAVAAVAGYLTLQILLAAAAPAAGTAAGTEPEASVQMPGRGLATAAASLASPPARQVARWPRSLVAVSLVRPWTSRHSARR